MIAAGRWTAVTLAAVLWSTYALAQPPGTLPPSSLIGGNPTGQNLGSGQLGNPGQTNGADRNNSVPSGTGTSSAATPDPAAGTPGTANSADASAPPPLQPRAFIVLDAAGNPVMFPGITFEKLDRLQRLAEGLERAGQQYSIDSLSINGRVIGTYAELNVTTRLSVEPTDSSWVSIPLRMGNFLRTGADVSGIELYRLDLDESGYVLRVKCDTRRSVVVSLRAVVRVSPAPTTAIEFRLPDTVCGIDLTVPDEKLSASIVGRGDEVLRTEAAGTSTTVKVEAGGGTFSLRFGTQVPTVDNKPVLEAETQIVVDWQQGDNAPLAKLSTQIRNLRGELPRLSILIPQSLELLQQPEVRSSGPFDVTDAVDVNDPPADGNANSGTPTGNRTGRRLDIVPATARSDTQVELLIDSQMRSEGGRPGGMVKIAPIAVTDAIEQKGEIEIRTPREYRLRWTTHPWVHSVWEKSDSDSLSSRTYRFRFDRVPFELPIWLSARSNQLRVESDVRVTLYESLASLRMTMKYTGSIPDNRILPIRIGDWMDQSVFIANTTNPVEYDREGDLLQVDLSTLPGGGNDGDRVEMVLVRPLVPGESLVELQLPQVVSVDESIGALPSTLTVVSQNESRFNIDLSKSAGLGEVIRRAQSTATSGLASEEWLGDNRYSLPDLTQPAKLTGYLSRERPSLALMADAEVSVIADRISEVVNWTIYPQTNLRGRLPIEWGDLPSLSGATDGNVGSASTASMSTATAIDATPPSLSLAAPRPTATTSLSAMEPWSVIVDDRPAVIRLDDKGQSHIYSENLGLGPHQIRFRRTRPLPKNLNGQSALTGVYLPRPLLPEVTLNRSLTVHLRGSDWWDLKALTETGRFTDELVFAQLPPKELTLELRPVDHTDDDLVIHRGLLRTAISDTIQYEQFLGTIEGSGNFKVGLTTAGPGVRIQAAVDGATVEVLRDAEDRCVIRLGDKGVHRVDLQLWVSTPGGDLNTRVAPVMRLPIGIEWLYWQLILPQDQHLVWATPTMGRAMRWELDRWRLNRVPLQSDERLVAWSGVPTDVLMPLGNRYLFVGIDAGSLTATVMSRQTMWIIVGLFVLISASLLIYVPAVRHPLTAVVAAIGLAGLMLLLPDAAVISGQLALVAMLIVSVMTGVRHLLLNRRGDRVFMSTQDTSESPTTRQTVVPREESESPYPVETLSPLPASSVAETSL